MQDKDSYEQYLGEFEFSYSTNPSRMAGKIISQSPKVMNSSKNSFKVSPKIRILRYIMQRHFTPESQRREPREFRGQTLFIKKIKVFY